MAQGNTMLNEGSTELGMQGQLVDVMLRGE